MPKEKICLLSAKKGRYHLNLLRKTKKDVCRDAQRHQDSILVKSRKVI
jgi:hypothetical protein